ncbi:MAG: acetoin utilization protein AcuC [Rubrobacteraceae bacterium]|uniref:acetoin utilization protein AcuC n=1 Tax=Rubrobacter naiadicus TaxID=1392641 RepID=UPI00236003BD|nr:acetoin utilization protein AcuC [Rubrobacter naiadicus]MBX6763595.1 acetoin utilization protein AcuC [Rubrobacteraceae bacterium]MCL6439352.1 acetoin utilization protein AcuC [Rubrobacteraceae bacterium]
MGGRVAVVHDRGLEDYGFGEDHPFNPLRIRLALELSEAAGLFEGYGFVKGAPATEEDLLQVHSLTYVRLVQKADEVSDLSELVHYGLNTPDNPVFPRMHEASARVVGAVLTAARMVADGSCEHAMCIAGGLHHALRSRASGFCVYNDAAVAIARLKQEHPHLRVAYLDTDAHHGDGVQWAFYDDPEVLTISMHETGRFLFPGTGGVEERGRGEGYGYAVNVPLEPFTDDESWISCFEAVVPEALRAFEPDIIISQNGCDGHALDPLTHLSASMALYEHIPRRVHELAHELCGGRWVALGGGGYDHWRVVPRAWTALWAALSHQELPEKVPAGWIARHEKESPVELPVLMHDPAPESTPRAKEIAYANNRNAERVLEEVVSLIHGRKRGE